MLYYLSTSESGGIGRRARLRGVWYPRTGSSPVSRTKNRLNLSVQPIFYPSRRLGISSRVSVYFLRLDDIPFCERMIYNSCGIDDMQGFALIIFFYIAVE